MDLSYTRLTAAGRGAEAAALFTISEGGWKITGFEHPGRISRIPLRCSKVTDGRSRTVKHSASNYRTLRPRARVSRAIFLLALLWGVRFWTPVKWNVRRIVALVLLQCAGKHV
jgi:hypothetical protein